MLDIKLSEIYIECVRENKEYNVTEIAKQLKESQEEEIEKYYTEEVATIKEGVTENLLYLNGIVVNVKKYPRYHFLIKESGNIDGVTTKSIIDYTSEYDFNKIEDFENNMEEILALERLDIGISDLKITLENEDESEPGLYVSLEQD